MMTFYDGLITGAALLYWALIVVAFLVLWRAQLNIAFTLLWVIAILAVPEYGLLAFYAYFIFSAVKARIARRNAVS